MNKSDYEYREIHTVVPQLDFTANTDPFSLFEETPVEHTIYASMENVKAMGAAEAAGIGMNLLKAGIGGVLATNGEGFIGMNTAGNALDKITDTTLKAKQNKDNARFVVDTFREEEKKAWPMLNFARTFQPANGYLGDIILEEPSAIQNYEGNGHQFFDNGNYFEGYFVNGRPSKGILIYRDGSRYIGGFDQNGNYFGRGLLLQADGSYSSGLFQNGNITAGLAESPNCAYFGEWNMGEWHGWGVLRNIDGACFNGDFKHGKPIE